MQDLRIAHVELQGEAAKARREAEIHKGSEASGLGSLQCPQPVPLTCLAARAGQRVDRISWPRPQASLLLVLEQRKAELDAKATDLLQQVNRVVELTQEKAQAEQSSRRAQAEAAEARAEAARSAQEKQLLEVHNAWLEQELAARTEQASAARRDLAGRLAEAETGLAQARDELGRARRDLGRVQREATEATEALAQSQAELRRVRAQHAEKEQLFETEVRALRGWPGRAVRERLARHAPSCTPPRASCPQLAASERLLNISREEAEDLKAQLHERDREVEALRGALRELEGRTREALEARKRAQEEAEAELRALREQLEDGGPPAALHAANGAVARTPGPTLGGATPGSVIASTPGATPGSWSALSEFQKYEKYAAVEARLREEARQRCGAQWRGPLRMVAEAIPRPPQPPMRFPRCAGVVRRS